MQSNIFIQTERLNLRQWCEEDFAPFAAMNRDPRVREFFFPTLLTPEQSNEHAKYFLDHIEKHNFGFFAASLIETGEFIGFIGIQNVLFQAEFNKDSPAVEIGWRLAFDHWGKGYATEGAQAALHYGLENLGLKEIVAFTTMKNMRSRNVMKKIGMYHDSDFDHPRVPAGHPLQRHVLYKI